MLKEIKMPAGGQTTDQSMVAKWMVGIGDSVNRGDTLLEIETDKTTLAVESFSKGIIVDILVEEGDSASSGEVLALLGDEDDQKAYRRDEGIQEEEQDEYRPIAKAAPKPRHDALPDSAAVGAHGIKAMPNAKKYARENGVDLKQFAKARGLETVKLAHLTASDAAIDAAPSSEPFVDVPHTPMRAAIARRMLESAQTTPVFHVTVEVDMGACMDLRYALNEKKNAKIGYNAMIMKAMATALSEYPGINASWTEKAVRQYKSVNIGLAVSLPGGLIVPVIKNAQSMGIRSISEVSSEMVTSARAGALRQDEISGGTITLSSLGMYSVEHFTAILNPPEACIIAVGSIREKAVVRAGAFGSAHMMTITATFDHRVVDGAYGAQFLDELKLLLENPAMLAC